MKTLFIFFALTMLASCNDAQRNRLSNCKNSTGKMISCADALSSGDKEYKAQYIAQVTVGITVGQSALSFDHSEYDEDDDANYNCNLDIKSGTKFSYAVTENKLTLKNSFTSLVLVKTDRLATEGLIGTWKMESAETKKVDAVTEMVFSDLNEVRIKKVCNLK